MTPDFSLLNALPFRHVQKTSDFLRGLRRVRQAGDTLINR